MPGTTRQAGHPRKYAACGTGSGAGEFGNAREELEMRSDDDIFNPANYLAVRRPLLEAETMPPWCYTSRAFYEREVERIFRREWNFIGRADRIPNHGDYFTGEFAGVPLVVVRGRDGAVRAFSNVCRHRGARIMSGEGNAKSFRCPYHSWSYRLDGRLERAPEMHDTRDFNPSDYGLKPVRLQIWAGFMFINFDPDAVDLMTFLGDLPELTSPYRFEAMTCVRRREYDLACNWKIYVENAMEAYHVPSVHMQTISRQKRENNPPIPSAGGYCGIFTRHEGSRAILPGEPGFPYIPTLTGLSAQGTYYVLIYPSTMFGCTLDCMWWLELHPRGPGETRLTVGSCFPDKTIARDDFDTLIGSYYRRWETSMMEDNVISEQQQEGIRSPLASPGRLSYLEPLVHTIGNWVLDRVLD